MPVKEKITNIEKTWGYEIWIVNNDKYCGKFLLFDRKAESSLHCHRNKTETFYCITGAGVLTIDGKDFDLSHSASPKTIQPGEWHQVKAIRKMMVLEVSTYHDEADVERKTTSKKGIKGWKLEDTVC